MPAVDPRIDLYFNNWYGAEFLGNGNPEFAIDAFRNLVIADQALRVACEAKLATLVPALTDKDFISRELKKVLEKVLAP